MTISLEFKELGNKENVCKLERALYNLYQALRTWYGISYTYLIYQRL